MQNNIKLYVDNVYIDRVEVFNMSKLHNNMNVKQTPPIQMRVGCLQYPAHPPPMFTIYAAIVMSLLSQQIQPSHAATTRDITTDAASRVVEIEQTRIPDLLDKLSHNDNRQGAFSILNQIEGELAEYEEGRVGDSILDLIDDQLSILEKIAEE